MERSHAQKQEIIFKCFGVLILMNVMKILTYEVQPETVKILIKHTDVMVFLVPKLVAKMPMEIQSAV